MVEEVVTLYRPTGPKELELVSASGYRRWPPRLPEQPIFYLSQMKNMQKKSPQNGMSLQVVWDM
jgi:hypothetical protein